MKITFFWKCILVPYHSSLFSFNILLHCWRLTFPPWKTFARWYGYGRLRFHDQRKCFSQTGKLVIPAFTKGREQLDHIGVEKTRALASVRIHVERVIGLLCCKYTILQSTLPTNFLNNDNAQDEVPIIDRIIKVCSALVNLCPPIVPFD